VYKLKNNFLISIFFLQILPVANSFSQTVSKAVPVGKENNNDPAFVFKHPPETAKPGVLWMWMGSNISKEGITKDLEALKRQGFNKTTMYSLADITTPWNREIGKSPNSKIIAWTEPWWKLVRHAALESKRLGMDFGMHNCPGYESSGGIWITSEKSMMELCWSVTDTISNAQNNIYIKQPTVDPRAKLLWPVFNPETGLVESPITAARETFYKDIALMALPAEGFVTKENIINLTGKLQPDGKLNWKAPEGKWMVYRFGYTTMGTLIQPAQWKATGLECDKMSEEAVSFHMNHVIAAIKNNIGDLPGNGFTHVLFDSYEAGTPTWTPKMQEEFSARRGYDLTTWLPLFAGRLIEHKEDSIKFRNDFDETVKDLYRDVYFKTIKKKLLEANLKFACEPYGGPWRQDDVLQLIDNVMTEFWTSDSINNPFLKLTIASLRKSGQNIVEAEAFTGLPDSSRWNETPHSIKMYGDAAFCIGVNRLLLHRFVHQPIDEKYKPGIAMGQWGTHFDRTQTWWKQSSAMVKYWQRCQALLQWGSVFADSLNDFKTVLSEKNMKLNYIHRQQDGVQIYFVANTSHYKGAATCSFKVNGLQPEKWNPVTGEMKPITQFTNDGKHTIINLNFDDAESCFIVFRKKINTPYKTSNKNLLASKQILQINTTWKVAFDPAWGGPAKSVFFKTLQDWTSNTDSGIKYYSGTAVYSTAFDVALSSSTEKNLYMDLGTVNHIAKVTINKKDLGIVWTAPWRVSIPAGLLKNKNNQLVIEVTNVWANRLIGDEQEPADMEWLPGHIWKGEFLKEYPDWFLQNKPRPSKGRYCFTTWKYFTKDAPLVPSGLLGPVRIIKKNE
jgi:alpha-L-rhamnosidase